MITLIFLWIIFFSPLSFSHHYSDFLPLILSPISLLNFQFLSLVMESYMAVDDKGIVH